MVRLGYLARKSSTAFDILRRDGIGGVTAAVRQKIDLRLHLFTTRKLESITLDGCTFSLKQIPNTWMRLALLKGDYEGFERRAVLQYVNRDQPVIELGGCIGVVSCITNRILHNPTAHVVVEANPEVVPLLEENRGRNQCAFEILNAAIAYDLEFVTFSASKDFWASSLHVPNAGTSISVRATSLRDIVSKRQFNTFTLICDIEGHEYDLVLNESDVLQKAGTIILETHARIIGEEKTNQMLNKLIELGFRIIDHEASVVVMKKFPA